MAGQGRGGPLTDPVAATTRNGRYASALTNRLEPIDAGGTVTELFGLEPTLARWRA
jgi:hypothetical protein